LTFRDLIDQQPAQALLRNALRRGHVSHAYLFVGPSGVGRLATARAFAQALLCETGQDDACDRCRACRKVAGGTHPDLRILAPGRTETGGERRAVGIDQIRELKRDAAYPPYEARWKVFIIEDAEAMRAEAANSLLKVLEEPPPGVVLILLTESTASLLPTIVSRAQSVRFGFVPPAEIARTLTSRGVPPDRARYLAALSGGRVGRALEAAGAGADAFDRRAGVLQTLAAVSTGDVVARLDAAEGIARMRDEINGWLDTALLWVRDLVIWQETRDPALLVNLDARREVAAWAGRADGAGLRRTAQAIAQAKENLRLNLNPRLVLEDLFVRIECDAPAQPVSRT
jgi:DNA polymerase III subunit delta'